MSEDEQRIVSDVTPKIERKVIRWNLWKEVSIFDHKCDKLPEGQSFHKFRITNNADEQHAFITVGKYEREVVCPYCDKHIIYVFTNVRRSGKVAVKKQFGGNVDE